MEIITLVRANIRHRKGSFTSIVILMMIISSALLAILSIQDDIYHSIEEAHQRLQTGDVISMMDTKEWSEDMWRRIKENELVEDIQCTDTIPVDTYRYNDREYSGNTIFLQELKPGYRLFHPDGRGYLTDPPELKTGECYVSRGMQTNLSCRIGDRITMAAPSGDHVFRIAGVIEDPMLGASVIGWKNVYISHEDFQMIQGENQKLPGRGKEASMAVTQIAIYKSQDCGLTDERFARELNLETGFADMSFGVITKQQSMHYTYLFPEIICSILIIFVLLLVVVVVVIICHSISSGIEMEYTTLGVMKSQGFSQERIRIIFIVQYLLAQAAGVLAGIFPAMPLNRMAEYIFSPITGILPEGKLSLDMYVVVIAGIFAFSILCMVIITGRIAKISPVRAMAGGRKEIWFDSRGRLPITKRALSASLALRQFTSNKRQYAGITAIVSILVFFMVTMMVLGNVITATSAWESMGIIYSDIDIKYKGEPSQETVGEVERIIKKYSGIDGAWRSCGNYYFSVDGEQIMTCIWSVPEEIRAVSQGRVPLYDNEIVMTEIAADRMGLKVGDKVTIGYQDRKAEYMISGLNQYMNDAGNNISMTKSAAGHLGNSFFVWYWGYILSDRSVGRQTADEINKSFGDELEAVYNEELMDETYQLAIHFMTAVVYIFSLIFAVVVVYMVCARAFLRERRDIGIYKAVGFTAGRLRLQFAVRFLIVAASGSLFGSGLAAACSEKLLSSFLRMVGISSFQVPFGFLTFAVPVLLICLCFFGFAFLAAGRIKKVEVKELVAE